MKTQGFNAGKPQEGIANSSKGKPCAGYLMVVGGNTTVNGLIVQINNQPNLFFDFGK